MSLIHRTADGTERVIEDRYCDRHDPCGYFVRCFSSPNDYDICCPVCRGDEEERGADTHSLPRGVPISEEVMNAPMPVDFQASIGAKVIAREMQRIIDQAVAGDA